MKLELKLNHAIAFRLIFLSFSILHLRIPPADMPRLVDFVPFVGFRIMQVADLPSVQRAAPWFSPHLTRSSLSVW